MRAESYPVTFGRIAQPDRSTIVIADDDDALRLLCRVNLELDGYRVLEASSRAELVRLLEDLPGAGVLLDLHLGADDGLAIARQLKTSRPDVRLAFFSGSVEGLETHARELSADFLPKPFSLAELGAVARRLTHRE